MALVVALGCATWAFVVVLSPSRSETKEPTPERADLLAPQIRESREGGRSTDLERPSPEREEMAHDDWSREEGTAEAPGDGIGQGPKNDDLELALVRAREILESADLSISEHCDPTAEGGTGSPCPEGAEELVSDLLEASYAQE